ncbi:BglG family transcription antiterminator [Listeria cossartiae subsp. cayugensis]|uniref:BglG family transcription antiterminator n=1 Tax=Listeria cossartiae subsp. cayugensis TaxID=2713505 RepID=A0ABU2IL15_9LIST|nr:BglG family transcription antiterminator [Listeria cossartiae]MDT0002543.1 BglG family transcription antiterminator [Listeria cossartiae subsp. cayugensis]MDT0019089.1 BglG family transcription antiterminator [Listeria cossartiae subsp. cayugensis]MDT0035338.1 BglG family transcription antiterminator [Listeria cossartiae subsp. cayugensis]MDT0040839.1 BglG family transcription antiterminator [Listeria cossartiae subsp. cayugensis]MDT0046040.1 BglG family transcription antiterminator [Lister
MDTQKEILAYLHKQENKWVTSNELADFCGCTTRTIRNNIYKINEATPGLINSAKQGYQINPNIQPEVQTESDAAERKSKLLLELIKNSTKGVDLFDLADILFISEVTLKKDIQQLKSELTEADVQIVIDKNQVKLIGKERAKRKYMISLLYEEGGYHESIKSHIQEMIEFVSIDKLQNIVKEVLASESITTNQYSMMNIVLHYAISIVRIQQGNTLIETQKTLIRKHSKEYEISKKIAGILSEEYQIHFSEAETKQLGLLYVGLQNEQSANANQAELDQFVDKNIIEALKIVLTNVEETYLIDLQNEQLFIKLAIHIQSLYYRSRYKAYTRNLSLLDIKTSYPVTFDIAVYISSLLQEKLAIDFNEDEISFIALHIGSFLESENRDNIRLEIGILVDDYHDLKANMLKKLQSLFENEATIKVMENEAYEEDFDIILTTNRDVALEKAGSIFIHPLLTTKDIKKITSRIRTKKKILENNILGQQIDRYIGEALYSNQIDPSELTPAKIREQMISKMEKQAFVTADFKEKVEKREQMAPTSFPSGIAIPHSIKNDALRSGVSIMTLQEPIYWNDVKVKIIALVAISKKDANEFNDFFEKFVEIVSEPINAKRLSMAESFEEFIQKLKMMIEESE